jgi:hypothetical protein
MGISVKKIAPTNEAERMHENDYQTAVGIYITTTAA